MKSQHSSDLWKAYCVEKTRGNTGLTTGIAGLDQSLKGIGNTVLIPGMPASCKSALASQILLHNARRGVHTIMMDKENGNTRLVDRLLSQIGGTSMDEIDNVSDASITEFKALPIHFLTGEASFEGIRAEVEAAPKDKSILLVIDSIQSLDSINDDQRVSMEKWMGFFDSIKVEYDRRLTILIISEKNRNNFKDTKPGMGSGKGSNSLDYKPETILDLSHNAQDDSFTVTIVKHRDGPSGASFHLKKKLADPSNPRSFCFQLVPA